MMFLDDGHVPIGFIFVMLGISGASIASGTIGFRNARRAHDTLKACQAT